MLDDLRMQVYEANMLLKKYSLVTLTWGNVSGINRYTSTVAIKPSGVEYETMKWQDIVTVDLLSSRANEGSLKPSSDTPTHLEIYRNDLDIGSIVHTHSRFATILAQAGLSIPALGTTHADYFFGTIPCTRELRDDEIAGDYELNTGKLIMETFKNLDTRAVPAVLVKGHGPFCWGDTPKKAVENALVLEEIAMMAYYNLLINKKLKPLSQTLLDKHYYRKHGKDAYYGQD